MPLTKLFQWFQSLFSTLIWRTLVRPALFLIRDKSGGSFKYTIYRERFIHEVALRWIRLGFRLMDATGGLSRDRKLYECLLGLPPGKSMLGFDYGSTSVSIQLFSAPNSAGSRGWDVMWVNHPQLVGKFKVESKKANSDSQRIDVECVWETGEFAGHLFTVTHEQAYNALHQQSTGQSGPLPTYIYTPWRPFLALELSMGGVLALVAAKWKDALWAFIESLTK